MIPYDAARSRDGAIYLAVGGVALLAAALLAWSTLARYLGDARTYEARLAFGQDRGREARRAFLELSSDAPGDATPLVLLAAHELERAPAEPHRREAAADLYQRALVLEPGRTSAVIGLAACRLLAAESRPPAERRGVVEEVEQLLVRARDPAHPDLGYVRGAAALLAGDVEGAREVLAREASAPPTREGLGARAWNRAAAAIMARDGRALELALPAFTLRRWPLAREAAGDEEGRPRDPVALLSLAFRLSVADPEATPTSEDARARRLELAARVLDTRDRSRGDEQLAGRFLPPRDGLPPLLNALGIGLVQAGRWEDAIGRFEEAVDVAGGSEPLYLLNLAEARRRWALGKDGKARTRGLERAAETYEDLCKLLAREEGREGQVALALANAASLYVKVGAPRQGARLYERYGDRHPDPTRAARDLGALYDHAEDDRCVQAYREALDRSGGDLPAAGTIRRRLRWYR